ncbi:hypothetical protein QJS10_CPA06g01203 [Acorus calamus]|uniref:Uncharacterized protein n=1 Tax=Acorus calamus TaxID=4465 RepID=A0AAV9EPL8_ACOCL|nr:hypothetical protein QJS10_CPA06g01203 [Acorus calamus]
MLFARCESQKQLRYLCYSVICPVTKSQRAAPTDSLGTKGPIIALSEIPEQSLSGQNPTVGPIKAIKGKEQNNSPKGNDTNRFSALALVTEDQVLEELLRSFS